MTLWALREQREQQGERALRQEPDEAGAATTLRQVGAWLWESVLGGRLQGARESGRALSGRWTSA